MKSNWLCSTMTAASSRDLETYSRLLGAVLKVWSFKATISYNKFSLLTDSKLSMYLFSTEGRDVLLAGHPEDQMDQNSLYHARIVRFRPICLFEYFYE